MKLLVRWLLLAAALLLVAHLSPGVSVNSFGAALVAALVLGLLNLLVRPLLVLLTLPVTVLTLGLFLFVINALMFWAAAGLLSGFKVAGFGAAQGDLVGAIDRLRAGQKLTRSGKVDFVEASIIDARLRELETIRRELMKNGRDGDLP